MTCPCFSNLPYTQCCEKYHRGELPERAVELMRSRYAAFKMGNADYIIDTTHPENTQYLQNRQLWKQQIEDFCNNTEFVGLDILDFKEGDKVSFVTFRAKLLQEGQDASFTERSRFEKMGGRWLYHSGEFKLGDFV